MSDGDSRRPDPAGLSEWVGYLKDIGVRELHLSSKPASRPRSEVKDPTGTDARTRKTSSPRSVPPSRPARPSGPDRVAQPNLVIVDGFDGFTEPAPSDPAQRLTEVQTEIGECTRCKLHEQRTNIVFGVGDPRARLMFVGEGPGAEEDARGEPFVGRAGKKLDEMIAAIGLARGEVYIANIVKCRPPKNRDPESDEIETCSPFLDRQIEAIRPRVIVTLGAPATKTLLRTRVGITKLRGEWKSYRGIPVMPTYHPAYLLRAYTKENRRKVFEDLKAARARMDE